jgi:hypothetical protein
MSVSVDSHQFLHQVHVIVRLAGFKLASMLLLELHVQQENSH